MLFLHKLKQVFQSKDKWILLFFILLLFPVFIITGVNVSSFSIFNRGSDALAKVGSEKVTREEFERSYTEQASLYQKRNPNNWNGEIENQLKQSVLNQLISARFAEAALKDKKLVVSDAIVSDYIQSLPAFQIDGHFSNEQYHKVLSSQNIDAAVFEAGLRANLAKQTYSTALFASHFTSNSSLDIVINAFNQELVFSRLQVNALDYMSQASASEEEIKNFYTQNIDQYKVPAKSIIEYILIDEAALAKNISITDAEVAAYYKNNTDKFAAKEQERRASHILFGVSPSNSEAENQKQLKKAQETLAKLRKNPAQFSILAKELSTDTASAQQGGDLGFFGKNMMVKPFEDTVFSLQKGQISDIVKTDYGYHIIMLTDIKGDHSAQDLTALKPQIIDTLKAEKTGTQLLGIQEQLSTLIYENPEQLKPIADKIGLSVNQIELSEKGLANDPIFSAKPVIDTLFSQAALNKKTLDPIEVKAKTWLLARVVANTPSKQLPLEEVSAFIKQQLLLKSASQKAGIAVNQILTDLRAGKAIGKTFLPEKFTISRSKPNGVPENVVALLLDQSYTAYPAYISAPLNNGNYMIYRIEERKTPEVAADLKTEQKKQIEASLSTKLEETWTQYKRATDVPIEIENDRVFTQ
jgi:peptidyl-prolyl cis-trans isomerase D